MRTAINAQSPLFITRGAPFQGVFILVQVEALSGVSTGFLRSDASVPSSAFPLPLKGRVRRVVFWILVRVCPLIPPTPFSHTGRRGRLGVLKPKTGEGTQALPKRPILVRCTSVPPACPPAARVPPPPGYADVPAQGERSWVRYVVCCIPARVCPLFPPIPFSHTGRRWRLGVLMAEMGDGTQGLAKKSTPVSNPLLPHGEKGKVGRPEAQNERRNAGVFQKADPCKVRGRPARLPVPDDQPLRS
jgi:hypothetical protein